LKNGDYEEFGRLFDASHESSRRLYEVSCAELDTMVEVCREAPGSIGSRLTGAGFGGCTISLVHDELVDQFVEAVKLGYERRMGVVPQVYVCTAEDGAGPVVTGS
ncbi:MAG: galactokinase, partial [Armatimonadota bacterium]